MDKARRATGWLGAEELGDEIRGVRAPIPRPRARMNHDALMAGAEEHLLARAKPISLVRDVEGDEQLGCGGAAWGWVRGRDTRETLRAALEDLQKDRSFKWSQEDDTFRRLDEAIGREVDFILAGHTHLERALRRRKTNGCYLNSGTWVRVIKLEPKVLADQAEFNKVYGAVAAGTKDALDKFDGLVLRRRTFVAVRVGSEGTRGELLHWCAVGRRPGLNPVDPQAGMTKT